MVLNQNTKQRIQDEFILSNQNAFTQFINDIEEKIKVANDLKDVVTKNIKLLEFIDNPNMNSESEFLSYYLDNVIPMIKYSTAFSETNDYEIKVFLMNKDIPESWPYFFHFQHQQNHARIQQFVRDETQTLMWLNPQETLQLPRSQSSDRDQYTLVSKLYSSTRDLLGIVTIMVAEDILIPSGNEQTEPLFFAPRVEEKRDENETALDEKSLLTRLITQKTVEEDYVIQADYIYFYKKFTEIEETLIYKVALHDLNTSLNKSTRNILLTMIATLIIFTISCIFMFKIIFMRLNRMVAIMRKVIQGDLKLRIPDASSDELGQLAQDMNGLMDMNNELIHNMIMKERLRKEAQIQALQYQINPHFIYNTLDVFRMRLIKEKMFLIADLLADFGKILRYNLSDQTHETTLVDELELIRKYMNLQKISTSQTIDLKFFIDDKLKKYPVIKFLLQPVVENCIKHGKSKDKENFQVTISSQIVNQEIYIQIQDNGNGIPTEKLAILNEMFQMPLLYYREENMQKGSIGLQNVNSRLRLYYGEQFHLVIESVENEYTCVTIKIPFQWEVESYDPHTSSR